MNTTEKVIAVLLIVAIVFSAISLILSFSVNEISKTPVKRVVYNANVAEGKPSGQVSIGIQRQEGGTP